MPQDAQFEVGSVVFVPDEGAAYLPKRVVSCKGLGGATQLTVGPLAGGGNEVVPKEIVALVSEADPLALEGADDMVKFTNLTEGALLHNLRSRYARDVIYSAAGAAARRYRGRPNLDRARPHNHTRPDAGRRTSCRDGWHRLRGWRQRAMLPPRHGPQACSAHHVRLPHPPPHCSSRPHGDHAAPTTQARS